MEFFEDLGRSPTLQDWQFRQAVQAVQRFCHEPSAPPWAKDFDPKIGVGDCGFHGWRG